MNASAAALLLALSGVLGARAQTAPTPPARSLSGQFLVTSSAGDLRRVPPSLATNASLLRLEPTFTAVSAERIKQAVWQLLEINGNWEQPIVISLLPTRNADARPRVYPDQLGPRRSYRVQMPAVISAEKYLQAVSEAVLREYAGRNGTGFDGEIPSWLTEGLAYHLFCNHKTELLLSAPSGQDNGLPLNRALVEYRQVSTREQAHKILLGSMPLTFEELSWPTPAQLEGDNHTRYQASAQVFVCGLLRLPDGPACLRNFVAALPAHQNWQLAFLQAFETHFKRPLDVEKWWSLEGLSFAQRDLTQTWPFDESWHKLDAALIEPVDVFIGTNSLPQRSQFTLEEAIRSWTGDRQDEVLQRKRTELLALQLRIAPELLQITADYTAAIESYLQRRDATTAMPGAARVVAVTTRFAEQKLLQQVAELERERARLCPEGATAAAPQLVLPSAKLRTN